MKTSVLRDFIPGAILIFFSWTATAQIFVDADATGGQTGNSWSDAYTDLQDALLNAPANAEVWIAEGIYRPGPMGSDSSTTFLVSENLTLLGGFVGNESNASERDPDLHPTILSGDINGDDDPGNVTLFRSDNVQHVVTIPEGIGPIRLDGLTIENGHASDYLDQDNQFWRGGGIYALSTVEIVHCLFRGHYGGGGAALYLGGDQPFSCLVRHCTFVDNSATSQSAGILLDGLQQAVIDSCAFLDNLTTRGALYTLNCEGVTISNCEFSGNTTLSSTAYGGAIFNWQSTGIQLENCAFINNEAGNGAAIYHDGSQVAPFVDNLVIYGCLFQANTASDWGGGAIYSWEGSYTIDSCAFLNNTAPTSGGHIFSGGTIPISTIRRSTFSGGSASFGGAHTSYGDNAIYLIEDNTYSANQAGSSGGAVIIGFGADATVMDCTFANNSAGWGAGVYAQNDESTVTVENCTFIDNSAENNGGGMAIEAGIETTISGCVFTSNQADLGGGLSAIAYGAPEPLVVNLSDCIFQLNLAQTQGGGLNLIDAICTGQNILLHNNIAETGGGISLNSSDDTEASLQLVNATLAENVAGTGAGLAQFEGIGESACGAELQNVIFSNTGENYVVEGGDPALGSAGGNLSTDETLLNLLMHSLDQHLVSDVGFVSLDDYDFHLISSSPAVNAGVDAGAPPKDLDGQPRVGQVDIGAYEYPLPVSWTSVPTPPEKLSMYPVPADDEVNLVRPVLFVGDMTVHIIAQDGRVAKNSLWPAHQKLLTITLQDLLPGIYQVVVTHPKYVVSQDLIIAVN